MQTITALLAASADPPPCAPAPPGGDGRDACYLLRETVTTHKEPKPFRFIPPTILRRRPSSIPLSAPCEPMLSTLSSSSFALIALTGICAIYVFSRLWHSARLREKMPPGPPGVPLLGNALQLSNLLFLRFTEWKEEYGA